MWSPTLVVSAAALTAGFFETALQTGKWFATVNQLRNGGSANLTIEPRNDEQSRAKLSFRNGSRDMRIARDVATKVDDLALRQLLEHDGVGAFCASPASL